MEWFLYFLGSTSIATICVVLVHVVVLILDSSGLCHGCIIIEQGGVSMDITWPSLWHMRVILVWEAYSGIDIIIVCLFGEGVQLID